MFLEKGVLKICSKFTGEYPSLSAISIKLLFIVRFENVRTLCLWNKSDHNETGEHSYNYWYVDHVEWFRKYIINHYCTLILVGNVSTCPSKCWKPNPKFFPVKQSISLSVIFSIFIIKTSVLHPSRFVLRKGFLKICSKFTGEHSCGSVISIKLQSNFF